MMLLLGAGAFTLCLGIAHFFFPYLLDFDTAIPMDGAPLKEFKLLAIRHSTSRKDVRNVVWLINGHVSYTLVTIGVLEFANRWWLDTSAATVLLLWVSTWWFLRALYQMKFDGNLKSHILTGVFLGLGAMHGVLAVYDWRA